MSARSMAGAFLAMVPLSLAIACSDKTPAPGPSATEVPLEVSMSEVGPPTYVTDDLDISARELLRRSDAAMREIDYLRLYEAIDAPPAAYWSLALHETVAPLTISAVTEFSLEEVGGALTWIERVTPPDAERHVQTPHFLFDRAAGLLGAEHLAPQSFAAEGVRLIGEDRLDGRPAWVVWYHHTIDGFEGPITDFVTEWIDKQSLLLVRQQTNRHAPYDPTYGVLRVVFDVNQPDAPLRAPVELPEARLMPLHARAVFIASADATVSRLAPDENAGDRSLLSARAAGPTRSLIRFEAAGIPSGARVVGAWLGLNGSASAAPLVDELYQPGTEPRLGTIHRTRAPWDEAAVTWNTAPSPGSPVAELYRADTPPEPTRVPASGDWLTADVSHVVTGNGEYGFYVLNESDRFGSVFSSREGEHPPVLVVTFEYTDEPPIPLPTP